MQHSIFQDFSVRGSELGGGRDDAWVEVPSATQRTNQNFFRLVIFQQYINKNNNKAQCRKKEKNIDERQSTERMLSSLEIILQNWTQTRWSVDEVHESWHLRCVVWGFLGDWGCSPDCVLFPLSGESGGNKIKPVAVNKTSKRWDEKEKNHMNFSFILLLEKRAEKSHCYFQIPFWRLHLFLFS